MIERQASADKTRGAIVKAARKLLTSRFGPAGFSVDAVAKQAGVARMTVYYQFKSKTGLLEALVDDLADRADMRRMREVFQEPSLERALDKLLAIFGRLYATDRLLIRRLTALAKLDPDVDRAMSERNAWRREALENLLARWNGSTDAVDLLHALTSFETFDALAAKDCNPSEVVPAIARLVRLCVKGAAE